MERSHLIETFQAPRIVLSRVATTLSTETRGVIDRERARFLAYFPGLDPARPTMDLARDVAREAEELWSRFEEYAYEIRDRETGRFIGHASVTPAFRHDCAELTFWVRSDAEGKGYISEAVATLEQYLFGRGFQRIEMRCDVLNESAHKVPKRSGYTLEGRLREHMKRRDGSYSDSLVFGKLAREGRDKPRVDAT